MEVTIKLMDDDAEEELRMALIDGINSKSYIEKKVILEIVREMDKNNIINVFYDIT